MFGYGFLTTTREILPQKIVVYPYLLPKHIVVRFLVLWQWLGVHFCGGDTHKSLALRFAQALVISSSLLLLGLPYRLWWECLVGVFLHWLWVS
jgi:hypothetical protein